MEIGIRAWVIQSRWLKPGIVPRQTITKPHSADGQVVSRKARQCRHSQSMSNWRNTADGHLSARPQGAAQPSRLSVALLDKDQTIACAMRLDPERLESL
ncbi:MAG TPA: hypothetical protein EYH06_06295 [Chromatiales bacterium]|nr:hypothetical protein [Thiotrichales bacterium]HIP68190.1 hypothetical protein [Chromatiales bacterium]